MRTPREWDRRPHDRCQCFGGGGCRGRTEEIGSLGISLPETSKDPAFEPLEVTDTAKSQAQEALLAPFPSSPGSSTLS